MPAAHYVGVVGKRAGCPRHVADLARACGVQLARLGVVVVCGGMGGVMEAAAQGATAAGGVAIGLIPEGAEPSPHLTYALRTGLPFNHRNLLISSAADLLVVLPGSHGTMIEGWAAADRALPMVKVGPHWGHPTDALPYVTQTTPPKLGPVVAQLLGLPGVG